MRALVLGPEQEALIAALVATAAREPVPYHEMKQWAEAHEQGRAGVMRELNSALTMEIPVGYRATYTHEEHKPGVVCRHLSVSVDAPGKGPHPVAMGEIMRAFGFKNPLGACPAWMEDLGRHSFAINVVEPLDGDLAKLRKVGA